MTGATVLAHDVNQLARALGIRRRRTRIGCGGQGGNDGRTDEDNDVSNEGREFHAVFQRQCSRAEDGLSAGMKP